MFAVIKTGGKQYRVSTDDVLDVEKLSGDAGDQVIFDSVLFVGDGETASVGAPFVEGASVAGEIVDQKRARKIIILKKRRRQNSRRRNGHRQMLTSVRITDILTDGKKPAAKKTTTKKPAAEKAEPKVEKQESAPDKAAPETKAAETDAKSTDTAVVDDIALIGGVGPKLKQTLADAGVTSLSQIADLDAEAAEKLDSDLDLKGRVVRDEWVEQAKELLAGKPPRAKTDREAAKKDSESE